MITVCSTFQNVKKNSNCLIASKVMTMFSGELQIGGFDLLNFQWGECATNGANLYSYYMSLPKKFALS